jgi:diacylglycerol kinase family enzyme
MDGMFDIQVFKGPRRLAFSVMPRVIRGTHVRHSAVQRFVSSSFSLECEPEWPVEADGEMIGTGQVTGTMIPGALRFKI